MISIRGLFVELQVNLEIYERNSTSFRSIPFSVFLIGLNFHLIIAKAKFKNVDNDGMMAVMEATKCIAD
jgi:hypothetical protein